MTPDQWADVRRAFYFALAVGVVFLASQVYRGLTKDRPAHPSPTEVPTP